MVQIITNLDEVRRAWLFLPRAAAKALDQAITFAAKIAQGKIKQELPSHFKIRNTWIARQIKVDHLGQALVAIGVDRGDPEGKRNGAPFMREQELGGEKNQRGEPMAVPIGRASSHAKGATSEPFRGQNLMGKTLQSRWPTALKNSFTIKTGNGRTLVVQTRGPRGHGRLKVAYVLKRRVRIKARWNFRQRVNEIVQAYTSRLFMGYLSRGLGK